VLYYGGILGSSSAILSRYPEVHDFYSIRVPLGPEGLLDRGIRSPGGLLYEGSPNSTESVIYW
jgi:hypothetical protein